MLPSTGLFKSFICPYFENGNGVKGSGDGDSGFCNRPFCHFKHVRKDECCEPEPEPKPAKLPEYKPVPKLLSLPGIIMVAPKKKSNLEYQPEKPGLNASPSKSQFSSGGSVPLYVPARKNSAANDDSDESKFDIEHFQDEITEICEIEADGDSCTSTKSINEKTTTADLPLANGSELSTTSTSLLSSDVKKRKRSASTITRERSGSDEKKPSLEKEKRRESDKEKERHKHKDREKDKSKTHSSSSSSSKSHKSSASSSASKSTKSDRHHTSSSSSSSKSESKYKSSSSRTSSSSSSSKREHSSKSSSSSKHKSNSKSSTTDYTSDPKKPKIDSDHNTEKTTVHLHEEQFEADIEFPTSTEADIMKECEMIYDQLEQEFAAMHKAESKGGAPSMETAENSRTRKPLQNVDDYAEAATAAIQKKRVAHENATKIRTLQPPVECKPNHIRNAMQAIFNRREELRQKQLEEAAKADAELRAAEDKVREANEALRVAKEKALTPLIPKAALIPPIRLMTRTIAPVANMIALERAKKKVDELRAEKKPAFTPAQIKKGASRVAHRPSGAVEKADAVKQPKPPVLEANNSKISFNIRMQYYEMMVKHCLEIYPNQADAWERAQTEELSVFKKIYTPVIYKNSCMLTINKLRKEAIEAGNTPKPMNKIESHEVNLAGKRAQMSSWSVEKKRKTEAIRSGEPFDGLRSDKAFELVYDLRLTDEQLVANGFPRPGKRSGTAIIQNTRPNRRPNETERYCSRCGKAFQLSIYDEKCSDECNYHPKSTGYQRGFADNLHRCCQQPASTPGCSYANYHVSDYYDPEKLTCFVSTIEKPDDYVPTKKDIYALDCEMCYTTHGIELTRITVVDINGRVAYDALVKPENKIVDYNTIYSGITEQMLMNETRTLRDVQAVLMSMFHSKTVLVGHSLESDLKALKLIHNVVVDTSVLFPHKMGPPKKRALKTLCIENLKRIIQENDSGHDSAEDAEVCIQLIKFYLRNRIN